jgi:hypothetical protein
MTRKRIPADPGLEAGAVRPAEAREGDQELVVLSLGRSPVRYRFTRSAVESATCESASLVASLHAMKRSDECTLLLLLAARGVPDHVRQRLRPLLLRLDAARADQLGQLVRAGLEFFERRSGDERRRVGGKPTFRRQLTAQRLEAAHVDAAVTSTYRGSRGSCRSTGGSSPPAWSSSPAARTSCSARVRETSSGASGQPSPPGPLSRQRPAPAGRRPPPWLPRDC